MSAGELRRDRSMLERAIMAGFGGQGLMFMGKLVAKMMMDEGMAVTYFPSYGAEVRGGTANCHVIVSSGEIASPIVEEADTIVVMNQPSYDRFKSRLAAGGVALVNSSLVQAADPPAGRVILEIPATQMAGDLGDVRAANMVMMGAYNVVREFVPFEKLLAHMADAFGVRKKDAVELNGKAIELGREFARGRLVK